jgi:hypothetical protein
VFGLSVGAVTQNYGSEQADLDDLDDAHVRVTRGAPDLPAPRLELLEYHVGTRRAIPSDSASNDIAATHSVVKVASLEATTAALAGCGLPVADDDIMVLREGTRAALVRGPWGHRFLVEEGTRSGQTPRMTR